MFYKRRLLSPSTGQDFQLISRQFLLLAYGLSENSIVSDPLGCHLTGFHIGHASGSLSRPHHLLVPYQDPAIKIKRLLEYPQSSKSTVTCICKSTIILFSKCLVFADCDPTQNLFYYHAQNSIKIEPTKLKLQKQIN